METQTKRTFDIQAIRADFPTLHQHVYKHQLIYFDNGATSQKPQSVIDVIEHYYTLDNANIHRGVHYLSQKATDQYENARNTIAHYINAKHTHEVLFTKGASDSINLVAFSFGELLNEGDEIIISAMEHHSNIVPWQMTCERKKCVLKVIPINEKGELCMDVFDTLLTEKTKLVSITHISNTLGTINPIKEIIDKAHAKGAKVLIDGAQSIQHLKIDVQALDCDFYAFSGHKVFGPTGTGILYGKEDILNAMPPYQGGGDMIDKVTFEKTTYNALPYKFEAGTPHISGGIALAEAFRYLNQFEFSDLANYEKELLDYGHAQLAKINDVEFVGTAREKASVISFNVKGLHPFDVGTLLDKQGVAVRTGHHCTQPLMDFFGIPGTIRSSFAFYNTKAEIDYFITALTKSIQLLK
ncbi:MAG TPA: cysteine desulfurase [Crocinitomicaceae bacterium]|nr:cysteine desulfurase [Crocinitomicaceae bacterium]